MPDRKAPSNLSRQAVGMRDYAATPEEYQPLSIQERIADRIYGGGEQAREGMTGIAEGRPWEAYKIPLGGLAALFSPISAAAERGGEAIATSGRAGLPELLAGALAQGTGEALAPSGGAKILGLGIKNLRPIADIARKLGTRMIGKRAATTAGEAPYVPLNKRVLPSRGPAAENPPLLERRAPTRPTDEEFHANVARAYAGQPNPQGLTEAEVAQRLAPVRGGLEGPQTRPWPGIYKGGLGEGRTQPKSYRSPKTYDLSEYE